MKERLGLVGAAAAALSLVVAAPAGAQCGTAPAPRAQASTCASRGGENGSFTAELNGFKIHYEVRGKGPILMVLPNSWGLSLQGLRGLLGSLEERFTLVTFDPRGMGGSEAVRRPSDMSMAAVREDFDALRRHLKIQKANVIGWSNGAINLILLASERPETLSGAIFLHGAAHVTAEDDRKMAEAHAEAFARYAEFMKAMQAQDLPPAEADARLKEFYLGEAFPDLCADPEATAPKVRGAFDGAGFSWAHTRYATEELPAFDFRDRLAGISARSLVIAGAHDLIPAEDSRDIATGIPGARFRLFTKSGHFAPLEEREGFLEAVTEFLGTADTMQTRIEELERWALDRWGEGDPSGFVALYHPDATYFDPGVPLRLSGLPAIREHLEKARGRIRTDRYEMVGPKVELFWDAAVLTYDLSAWSGGKEARFHCTEVYRKTPAGWKILQSHWSVPPAGPTP